MSFPLNRRYNKISINLSENTAPLNYEQFGTSQNEAIRKMVQLAVMLSSQLLIYNIFAGI